jgi:hypothetical protein
MYPYQYLWSNGAYNASNINRCAGTYSVTVTDAFQCTATASATINNPQEINISVFKSDVSFYGADDGVIDITVSDIQLLTDDGLPAVSYLWSNGATTQDLENLDMGTYTVTVTKIDGNCSKVVSVNISEPEMIDVNITASGNLTFCYGNNVILDAGSGFESYLWSNGATSQTISVSEGGIYYVSVTNINSIGVDSVSVHVIKPYANQELCVVTVDTTNGKNLIVWEPTLNEGIVSYNIYKETTYAGQYALLGNVLQGQTTILTDTASNPAQKSDRYKISVIDTCGNESELSNAHKTMHLTVSTGIGVYNLIWENYEGFSFGSYIIYKGASPSDMVPIGAIQSNITTFSDFQTTSNNLYYQIAIIKDDTCFVNSTSKTQTGPYSQTVSNLDDTKIDNGQSVEELKLSENDLQIYPNPFNTSTIINFRNPNKNPVNIIVSDLTGKIIKEVAEYRGDSYLLYKENLETGFYLIEVRGKNILRGKVVVK